MFETKRKLGFERARDKEIGKNFFANNYTSIGIWIDEKLLFKEEILFWAEYWNFLGTQVSFVLSYYSIERIIIWGMDENGNTVAVFT